MIALCTLGMAIGVGIWKYSGNSAQTRFSFETVKIKKADITNMVTATGTIEPVIKVEVGTQVSGIVNKLYVDYNSLVKKGQVIAELDKTNLLNEANSAKANMANAQTEFDYQTKNYNRIKILHDKGLVSDTDYEQALYTWESARNSLEVSKNNYAKAQTNLGYAIITAPIDGVVLSKDVEEGQTVAASFSTPTLFYIANDLTQMRVIADVDEADIGEVKEGQKVTFEVDAYIGTVFNGSVTQVRQNATTTNNVVTYEVVISAPNPDLKLKPGLTANVKIYTLEENNVLCAEAKAFKFTPNPGLIGDAYNIINHTNGNTPVLWTLSGNTFTAVPVQTGTSNRSLVEIKGGIEEGALVVTEIKTTSGAVSNTTNTQESESSPFMPGPPNSKKR